MTELLQLHLGWFDLVATGVLAVGLIRGRRRGMSEELLDVFKWLAIVVASARYYQPLANLLTAYTHVAGLLANLTAYIVVLLTISLLFSIGKRLVGEKLVGSDTFGNLEYYLGMAAGVLRYGCVLLVVLAVLHAPHISEGKRQATAKMQRENFGNISFPTLSSIQDDVFSHSILGRLVDAYLDSQLIAKTSYVPLGLGSDDNILAKRKERALDEVISGAASH